MPRVTFRETPGRNRLQIGLESPSRTLCRVPLVIEEPGCSVFGHFALCLMLFARSLTLARFGIECGYLYRRKRELRLLAVFAICVQAIPGALQFGVLL